MAAPSQRRALGALFLLLALAFGGIAFAAGAAEQWIIVGASAAIALWLAGLAVRGPEAVRSRPSRPVFSTRNPRG